MKFEAATVIFLLTTSFIPGWAQVKNKPEPVKQEEGNKKPAKNQPSRNLSGTKGQIILKWGKLFTETVSENGETLEFLNCKGARYSSAAHYIPEYFQQTKISSYSRLKITIVNPKYEALTQAELTALGTKSKYLTNEPEPQNTVVSIDKQPYANIHFVPVIKNKNTGEIEKLVSFSLNIEPVRNSQFPTHHSQLKQVSFASSSVLGSGTWFRLGVTKDGIYKMSYSFLKRAGVNMATLVPASIRVYGNGGGMLPENNTTPRLDDLVENAIYVNGQSDSVFTAKDYVLFYAQSPVTWTYGSNTRFHHAVNLYSDTSYYYVNIDLGPGKRIATETLSTATPTNTVNSFDDYAYHEVDGTNLIQSGSTWFGEFFDITTEYTFSFNFPNIVSSVPVYVQGAIASLNCNADSYYTIGSTTLSVPGVGCQFTDPYAAMNTGTYTFTPTSSLVYVTVSKITPGAEGWLYYLELNARRQLTMTGDQMEFRDSKSFGSGNISQFNIASFSNIQVWDVTNPQNAKSVTLTSGSGNYSFELPNDTLKQFMAFTGNSFDSATISGVVPNQNLHAMPQADLVIVSNPLFLSEAEQLATFHRNHDKLKVNVATTQQVYNEFSSGHQDPVAIRDFMRMFYDRANGNYTTSPKYLVLLGDGSYDPKNRLSGNTNYVVTYESAESFDPTASYVTDDFFALLDTTVTGPPDEGNYSVNIGVGRLPADNVPEAQAMVDKIISYETPSGQALNATPNCCGRAQYNLGNWKNTICLVAHDGNGDLFTEQMEPLAASLKISYPNFNVNKIYLDAYQMVQTPGGPRYPSVNIAIDQQMDQGLFIFNYDGHGGPQGLATSRVLDFPDIYSWTNVNTLPLFFNASCAFSEFDNPLQISGGALCVEIPNGGVIGIMGAAREVYASGNFSLNQSFYNYLYTPLPDGSLPRMGDLLKEAKNATGGTYINNLMFALLGDPAVRLAYPQNRVYTTSINAAPVTATSAPDTLKALAKVTISGYVGDTSGNLLSAYNGLLYPTIYDKPDSITTLDNLGGDNSPSFTFGLQNSTLYKGLISVNNGKFSYTFVVPKDILYYYGFGKISYYSENGTIDATGNFQNIKVGGTAKNVYNNGKGPKIRLYINDSNFVYGGLTNQNPQLFAVLFDSNGVNTASNSIGHDITAILDNNTANTYDLTNYYQPSLNSYQKGTITYPFTGLSNGTHTLSLRVWNVYDNTSITSTEFNVEPQSQLQLQHVLNYPNPFTTHTEFFFEINQVCDFMDVQIQIFSVSGKLVKNILTSVRTNSFRSEPIDWDGKDDYGDRIAKGVYIYHIKVRTDEGVTADTYQKLVIL